MESGLRTAVGATSFLVAMGLGLSTALVSSAQVAGESPNPACTSRPDCRFVGTVTIRTDQGDRTLALNRNMPFLRTRDGHYRLWLVLGERVVLRLGNQGEPPVVVDHGQASDPPKSQQDSNDRIEIDFAQMNGSTFTNMTVHNGYAQRLQYKAYMLSQSGDERTTSACPVLPGIFSVESWPGPVLEIELANFQLVDSGSTQITCQ
jgi:hypothetical protein